MPLLPKGIRTSGNIIIPNINCHIEVHKLRFHTSRLKVIIYFSLIMKERLEGIRDNINTIVARGKLYLPSDKLGK